MFKCGICRKPSKPREKAFTVVTETRNAVYPYRKAANTIIVDGKEEVRDDPGGRGTEIVSEILAHKSCATVSV